MDDRKGRTFPVIPRANEKDQRANAGRVPALEQFFGTDAGLSPPVIQRLTVQWRAEAQAFNARDLSEVAVVYVRADGIHPNVRLGAEPLCLLVLVRWSAGSAPVAARGSSLWLRGSGSPLAPGRTCCAMPSGAGRAPPVLAIGDGAMGFGAASGEVLPATRTQRCWFHKIANVLSALRKSVHPGAKKYLAEIYNAQDRAHAEQAARAFAAEHGVRWPRAAATITHDLGELLAFHDFAGQHWVHLRTTKPMESPFATVRHRTKVTKGPGSKAAGLAMASTLVEAAQGRWRAVTAPHLVALVRAGAVREAGRRNAPMRGLLSLRSRSSSDVQHVALHGEGGVCDDEEQLPARQQPPRRALLRLVAQRAHHQCGQGQQVEARARGVLQLPRRQHEVGDAGDGERGQEGGERPHAVVVVLRDTDRESRVVAAPRRGWETTPPTRVRHRRRPHAPRAVTDSDEGTVVPSISEEAVDRRCRACLDHAERPSVHRMFQAGGGVRTATAQVSDLSPAPFVRLCGVIADRVTRETHAVVRVSGGDWGVSRDMACRVEALFLYADRGARPPARREGLTQDLGRTARRNHKDVVLVFPQVSGLWRPVATRRHAPCLEIPQSGQRPG